jgi:hypothetical protein
MDVKRQFAYDRPWASLRAFFQEMEDGTLSCGCTGKPIRRGTK